MILVDSSVLISFLKGVKTPATRFLLKIESDKINFAIPNVCIQEVLQGAKGEKSWSIINDYLSTQLIISPKDNIESFKEAARIYFECRKKGLTIRSSTDCLIAQIAIENNATLLHNDKDFLSISRVRPLRFV